MKPITFPEIIKALEQVEPEIHNFAILTEEEDINQIIETISSVVETLSALIKIYGNSNITELQSAYYELLAWTILGKVSLDRMEKERAEG